MQIAFLQDYLRSGGTERQTLALAEGLSKLGHDIHLVVFRRGGVLDSEASTLPVTTHFLKQGPIKTDWFAPGLGRLLNQIQADAVVPMGRMANCYAGLLSLRKRRSFLLLSTFRTGRNVPLLYRVALRRCDHVVSNSREAIERIKASYGINRKSAATTIYNGCLLAETAPSRHSLEPANDEPARLLSVSMFRPQKQQIRLVRICAKLPQTLNWHLTLAGEGPTRAACRAEAERLGVADKISFPGLVKEPSSLYATADIAVHTSEKESLPNFLVEAQMSALPVVAYDVNGVSETFLHNESGFLVPHADESEFVAQVKKLIENRGLRRQMSESARDYASARFTREAQSAAYHRLLTRLSQATKTNDS